MDEAHRLPAVATELATSAEIAVMYLVDGMTPTSVALDAVIGPACRASAKRGAE